MLNIDIDWDPFERRIYLLDQTEQVIYLIDPQTLQRKKVSVKIPKYEVASIKATSNPNKVFLIAYTDFDRGTYLLDMSDKKPTIKAFLPGVIDIAVSAAGIYLYEKKFGIEAVPDGYIIAKEAEKRYSVINLIDDKHNEKNIMKAYYGAGFDSGTYFVGPGAISRDGSKIAFISITDRKKIKIYLFKSR